MFPQTRDLNPVYTGKDVSYIDTKQAQRAIEVALADAEALGAPDAERAEACRLVIYGSHHDAITGTESDQVYIDLLTGWRRAHDLATVDRARAIVNGAAGDSDTICRRPARDRQRVRDLDVRPEPAWRPRVVAHRRRRRAGGCRSRG